MCQMRSDIAGRRFEVARSGDVGQDGPMAGQHRRLRPVLGLVVTLGITLGWVAAPAAADAAIPAWNGGINLYRSGVFTTQKTWLWCTAADAQIMRNIKYRRQDHSRSAQSRYFSYMRARNRYSLPVSAGVDPQGWTAGLRRYVDDRYRLFASTTFTTALRGAVTRMRKTNLPVAVAVARGGHGWVLHGFTATADPAKTSAFTVTSVRVTGPLWGLQSRSYGYDMRPNTKLTVTQFKSFFTKWWYAPKRMIWDGKYVSIQPVPRTSTTTTAAAPVTPARPPAPRAAAVATPAPTMPIPSEITATTPADAGAAPVASVPVASTPPSTPPMTEPGGLPLPVAVAALFATVLGAFAVAVATRPRQRATRPPPVMKRPTTP
jgi:hypothetical protein